MNLYEINDQIRAIENQMMEWAEAHEGDITDFPLGEELDGLEQDKTSKLVSMGCWYKNMVADSEAIANEIKKLQQRKKYLDKKAERVKEYAATCLGQGNKLEDAKVVLSWHKSKEVSVLVEAEKLPRQYQRVKTTVEPDKAEIKKAIEAGEVLEFAKLVEKQNIQIK